jgi:hypothetical protein
MSLVQPMQFALRFAGFLVAIGVSISGPAHATFFSTDTQGTYNTGSTITTSNTFDLSGNGSAYVTISADPGDNIAVSATTGYLDASAYGGTLFVQPGMTLPAGTGSFVSATSGPFYIYYSLADTNAGDPATLFMFGALQYISFQFTDNGRDYTGYIEGLLDNSSGSLAFSVTDFGSNDPAAGPPVPTQPGSGSGSGPETVPEPASMALFGFGATAAAVMRRRRAQPRIG